MKNKEITRTESVLKVMTIVAWVAFFGFMVQAGGILFSYIITCVNPEGAKNFYSGLNLYNLRQFSFWHFTGYVSFMVALPVMKSWISFLVIKTLSKFKLKQPFTFEVAWNLEEISYYAFGTWVVTQLSNLYTFWILKITGTMYGNWLPGEFIFMVALVFIISQVFKRGLEIQSENELTV